MSVDPVVDPAVESAAIDHLPETLAALQCLVEVVAQLRHPTEGCPWDLAQTPESLIPYIIEEAYETVDAIRSGDRPAQAEELGDLLLQVVLQAQIASETGDFDLGAIAQGITEKLVRRHPHVFGDAVAEDAAAVRHQWDQIKATEKGQPIDQAPPLSAKLDRYVRRLPPLMAALKMSQKAAQAGFEWEDMPQVWAKFDEELAELKAAIAQRDQAAQESELGDLLFALVQVARWQRLDPAAALHSTSRRFVQRLQIMESLSDRPLENYSLSELDALWEQAKDRLRQGSRWEA
ncbi:MAG: nucleoside triphosphate pyrophosphohydrolase [Oscillatoriales cyanobacterium]|nr:MAG: nucleoside triphosphate pyrophosphohydrolase [Oscillatoriales cyanobacterium]